MTDSKTEQAREYFRQNQDRIKAELSEFLSIPSVSADGSSREEVLRAAQYVKDSFLKSGADKAEIIATSGHPLIYAEKFSSLPNAPTILIYGHYDVQPPGDPADWITPAFQPSIRDNRIYARGAADDKGQVFMHIKTLEYLSKVGNLPCNLKYLIEGEEEISSANLDKAVEELKDLLTADTAFISDTDMIGKDLPSITVGLRGIAYFEIIVRSAVRDLHSGLYGGAVTNPFHILARILSQIVDVSGRVTIPGFYDKAHLPRPEDKLTAAAIAPRQTEAKQSLGVAEYIFEDGYTPYESATCRPSFDIHGMPGGHMEEGAKTIIPAFAKAKISFRLVPDQDPVEISELLKNWLLPLTPPTVKIEVTDLGSGKASLLTTDSKEYRTAAEAIKEVYGKEPLAVRCGGSIPVVSLFERVLGMPTVMLGFGLEEDAIHAPNESFDLEQFELGMATIVDFITKYGQAKNSG